MKSRSLTASMLFWLMLGKPSSVGDASRSRTMVEPARAPEPSGMTLRRLRQSREAVRSRLEHFDVGEQVVGEEDRLAALEVGVAGDDRVRRGARRSSSRAA